MNKHRLTTINCRKEIVSTRLLRDGGAVLFDPDRNLELFINATGCEIWKLLDGRHPNDIIVEHLNNTFATATDIYQDFDSYTNLLDENGLLEKDPQNHRLADSSFSWHDESPLTFDLSITGHCNLRCPFCYYAEAINTRADLPIAAWLTFFKELQALGIRDLSLSGGEIFCRTDLFAIIDGVIAAGMRFSLVSNGTLGNEEAIQKLLEPQRRRRLSSIQISVDGSCPEIHDQIRGAGSFVKTDRFLRLLTRANLPTTARITINSLNLNDLEQNFAYLFTDIGLKAVGTNYACLLGSAVDNAQTMILTPQERALAMQTMRHLADNVWPGRINAQAGPLYESRQFESMANHQPFSSSYNGHLSACGCFRSKLAVHHDGVITPCNMIGNIELGRINHDSIKDIWLNSPVLKKLASRTGVSLKTIPECQGCEYIEICNGGCPATAISQTGDFFKPSLDNCYRAFKNSLNDPKN